MNKYLRFYNVYKPFQMRPDMYINIQPSTEEIIKYDMICAFLEGVEQFQKAGVLAEFKEWLVKKYQISSDYLCFAWSPMVKQVFGIIQTTIELNVKISNFLCEEINLFLVSKFSDRPKD